MPKLRTYTDETALGFINDELDALYTAAEAVPDLDDLGDITITSPADNEVLAYDSGSGDWINQTPTEAGLDALYLLLDASNDPVTGQLTISNTTSPQLSLSSSVEAGITLNDTGGYPYTISSASNNLDFSQSTTRVMRYQHSSGVLEIPVPDSEPSGFEDSRVGFYLDETNDELWAFWKDSASSTHHAAVARDMRTIVTLGGNEGDVGDATVGYGGASGDVGFLRFVDAATKNGVWSFRRPYDWDYGKIRVTLWYMNLSGATSGNHVCPQRLVGWAEDEDVGTPNGNILIAGTETIPGKNNAGKIGKHTIDDGASVTLSNEEFFTYRLQRQGANGSDTSNQDLEIIAISFELIAN